MTHVQNCFVTTYRSQMTKIKANTSSQAAKSWQVARQRLHVSAVPEALPCRDLEFMEITAHLEGALESRHGTCLCKPSHRKPVLFIPVLTVKTFRVSREQGKRRLFAQCCASCRNVLRTSKCRPFSLWKSTAWL